MAEENIKMEFDEDCHDEDFILKYDMLDEEEEIFFDKCSDPLLTLKPIVYTTKLDNMNTVKQDLTNLNAKEILQKLLTESKPTLYTMHIKERVSNLESDISSFTTLAKVVSDINNKCLPNQDNEFPYGLANRQSLTSQHAMWHSPYPSGLVTSHSLLPQPAIALPHSDQLPLFCASWADNNMLTPQNTTTFFGPSLVTNDNLPPLSTVCDSYTSSKQDKCKPCSVLLHDIKHLLRGNQTIKLSVKSNKVENCATVGLPCSSNNVSIKEEVVEENETSDLTKGKGGDDESSVKARSIKEEAVEENKTSDPDIGKESWDIGITTIKDIFNVEPSLKYNKLVLETGSNTNPTEVTRKHTKEIVPPTKDKGADNEWRERRTRKKNQRYIFYSDEDNDDDEEYELPKKVKKSKVFTIDNTLNTQMSEEDTDDDEEYEVPKKKVKKEYISANDNTMTTSNSNSRKNTTSLSNNRNNTTGNSNTSSKTTGNSNTSSKTTGNSNTSSNTTSLSSHASVVVNDSAQVSALEKYALIVLMHKKKAFIYRVNPTRLMTDFHITNDFNEYALASMYPKEEKIIEQYCCWYRREAVIAKICSRKNYPFTIQKFLKQPHNCYIDDCQCCCRSTNKIDDNNQCKQTQRRDVMNRSLAAAEEWIRGLLAKNNSTAIELVSKAINFTPKAQKDSTDDKQAETYLENTLLCFKNCSRIVPCRVSGGNRNDQCYYELYDIGKNGVVIKSFIVDDEKKLQYFRKQYQSLLMREIKDAELCCWFKREKVMQELRMLKASPAALKQIQEAHSCVNKNCSCCCKPKKVALRAITTLPSTLKHTTVYEKDKRSLIISFKAKAKYPAEKPFENPTKITKSTGASTAAVVLSDCAFKDDNPHLSISILSKFKSLKLGVNSEGEIEAILDEPAKNLSISELTVLSEIVALSIKQTAVLGLSTEEFCNRINSKYQGLPSHVTVPDTPLIRSAGVVQLQDINDERVIDLVSEHNEDETINVESMNFEDADPVIPNVTHKIVNNTAKTIQSSPRNQRPIEYTKKAAPTHPLKPHSAKFDPNMLTSLSSLMETKSKNYVDSFKSFFNKHSDSYIVLPQLYKVTPKPVDEVRGKTIESTSLALPIIVEAYTLPKSPTEVPIAAMPGPSGVMSNRMVETSAKLEKVTYAGISGISQHQPGNHTNNQAEIKLRVKPVSELVVPPASMVSNNIQTMPITSWPAPILNKHEPQTNIQKIVTPTASTTIALGTNVQNQPFVIAKSQIPLGSRFQLVSKPMNNTHMETNSGAKRFITLMPLKGSKVVTAQSVRPPHFQSGATSSANPPRLVPIQSAAVRKYLPKQNPAVQQKRAKRS